jgi:hypothetical protein
MDEAMDDTPEASEASQFGLPTLTVFAARNRETGSRDRLRDQAAALRAAALLELLLNGSLELRGGVIVPTDKSAGPDPAARLLHETIRKTAVPPSLASVVAGKVRGTWTLDLEAAAIDQLLAAGILVRERRTLRPDRYPTSNTKSAVRLTAQIEDALHSGIREPATRRLAALVVLVDAFGLTAAQLDTSARAALHARAALVQADESLGAVLGGVRAALAATAAIATSVTVTTRA